MKRSIPILVTIFMVLGLFQISCGGGDSGDAGSNQNPNPNPNPSQTPVAVPDSYRTLKDIQLQIPMPGVLSNDTDPDADLLYVSEFDTTTGNGGVISMASDGSFIYSPPANFTGNDSFQYKSCDGILEDIGTVNLQVKSIPTTISKSFYGYNAHDQLGYSVLVDHERLVMSSPGNDMVGWDGGTAYGYLWNGATNQWLSKAGPGNGLIADTMGEFFGERMALRGDDLIVGCPADDSHEGKVYTYQYNPATGTYDNKSPMIEDRFVISHFGQDVDVYDDVLAVGAKTVSDIEAECIFVYRKDGGTGNWVEEDKIYGKNVDSLWFGKAVAVGEDLILSGDPYADILGTNSGAVYVYKYDDQINGWLEDTTLFPSDGAPNDLFGYSVAFEENVAVVGAIGSDTIADMAGAAYVFVRNPNSGAWHEGAKLSASDGAASDRFGYTTSLNANLAIIGAPKKNTNQGAAYIYVVGDQTGTANEVIKLTDPTGSSDDEFGGSVDISSNWIGIGAKGDDTADPNAGAVFIYRID